MQKKDHHKRQHPGLVGKKGGSVLPGAKSPFKIRRGG